MNRRVGAFIPLILLFSAKYIQIYSICCNPSIMAPASIIALLSALSIVIFSFLFHAGRWRDANTFMGSSSAIIIMASILYPDVGIYLLSNIFLATALFIFLYPLHSYETRKFAAFGYAFLLIYVLLEGISLWRGDFDLIVFASYLTLSLIMFLPGALKIE